MATTVSPSVYRSPLRRMLYASPLHTTLGKIIFAAIMLVFLYLGVGIWVEWLTPLMMVSVLLFGLAAAFLGSLIGIALLRYLDRREPESWFYFVGVLLFALLTTVAPAAYFNGISPWPLLTVGFNEDFWKVAPLLLLVFFAPTVVTGTRDGLIYGALGGFAFNILETATYFLRVSFPEAGLEGMNSQLVRLGIFGYGDHIIWGMLVGGAIGVAVNAERRWVKLAVPLGAYLLSALTHSSVDLGGGVLVGGLIGWGLIILTGGDIHALQQQGMGAVMPYFEEGLRLSPYVINIIPLIFIVRMLLGSGNWERQVVREELADEVGCAITLEEYEGVKAERRFGLRRVTGYSARVGRQIRNAQNALAFHKRFLKRRNLPLEGDPLAEYYRDEIERLRLEVPIRRQQTA